MTPRPRTSLSLFAAFIVLVAASLCLVAADATTPSSTKPGQDKDLKVHITADNLRYDDQKHFLTLDGHVRITHLDTTITGPHAEFYTDTQIGHFTGGVRITQPGTTITGDKLDAFYIDRKAILTGSVQMVTEKVKGGNGSSKNTASASASPKPSKTPKSPHAGDNPPATNLPTVVLADQAVYFWEKQEGDAYGNVKIRNGDKRGFSDRAHYAGAINQITMYQNVRYERGPHDWLTCEKGILDTATNVFTAQGDVEGLVVMESASPSASPSPSPSPQGDRVLKPMPPVLDAKRAPDGVPTDLIPGTRPSTRQTTPER